MLNRDIASSTKVTSTQLVRDFPQVRHAAEEGPVFVTSHGRADTVVMSADNYLALVSGEQADVRSTEWKLNLVLDSVETHILILDEELRIRRTNRYVSESFAVPAEELVGKYLASFAKTPSEMFVIQRLAEVLSSGQPEIINIPASRDKSRVMRTIMKPWPGGVAMFATDITERERMQDQKIADIAVDAALEAAGGVGIVHVLSTGDILSASLALSSMVGSSEEMLAGTRLQNLLDPACRSLILDALGKPSAGHPYNVRYLRHGVDLVPAILSIAPYWTAENHSCAAVALIDHAYGDRAMVAKNCVA